MPIEIKELHIKAIVTEKNESKTLSKKEIEAVVMKMKKEIIKECMEEVKEFLENKTER